MTASGGPVFPVPISPVQNETRQRLVFRVAQLFLAEREQSKEAARKANRRIAEHVAERIREEFHRERFTREMVYDCVYEAIQLGFLVLVPPFDVRLQEALTRKYPHLAQRLYVVATANHLDNKRVSVAAARIAVECAKELAAKLAPGDPLGLGLGPGRATRDFCEAFGHLITRDPEAPKLDLVAITAGCPAREPEYASISFFNQFDDRIVNQRVGLFAETLVHTSDLRKIRSRAGAKEAFAARDRIHMVITSMGDMKDPDDLLGLFLAQSRVNIESLLERGWIGNVQYRPYTADGPVRERPSDLRAVTLFELDDLVRMAGRDDKCVILIARQCGKCRRTRATALEPLLREHSPLRVFSHLVMDTATCEELLGISSTRPPRERPA